MNETIMIQPIEVVRSCVAVRMRIQDFHLNALRCSVRVDKLDAIGNLIDLVDVPITEEEYALWGQDDQYIITLVMTKLGMTPIV